MYDYPLGTKAHSYSGGYWIRVSNGWRWCTGAVFPRPGADVGRYEVPDDEIEGVFCTFCKRETLVKPGARYEIFFAGCNHVYKVTGEPGEVFFRPPDQKEIEFELWMKGCVEWNG
jgi:hypothetical protein